MVLLPPLNICVVAGAAAADAAAAATAAAADAAAAAAAAAADSAAAAAAADLRIGSARTLWKAPTIALGSAGYELAALHFEAKSDVNMMFEVGKIRINPMLS